MNGPLMQEPRRVAPDTDALTAIFPLPGLGVLPVTAHVLRAAEPVLVDTGLAALREPFLEALRSVIDPGELRWIWLTHTDLDHAGNLQAVLDLAPEATLVTTYLGLGKLGLQQLEPSRVHLLNPGQTLDVGDRKLLAVTPPTFDAPETTGFLDTRAGTLFSSDCFGAILEAPVRDLEEIDAGNLREGMITWATVDAPWLQWVDGGRLDASLEAVRGLRPDTILSSHLPPARGMHETLLGHVASARLAPAFVGPDQAALERMMAGAPE